MNPLLWVAGTILVISLASNGWLKIKVGSLTDDLSDLEKELAAAAINSATLEATIDENNEIVNSLSVDYANNLEKLDSWKAKPAEVRYNVIYKTLYTKIDTKVDSCENTKSVISSVRDIDFNAI